MGSKAPGGQQASLVTFVTNFIVLGVIGADERADIVDDDAYTTSLACGSERMAECADPGGDNIGCQLLEEEPITAPCQPSTFLDGLRFYRTLG